MKISKNVYVFGEQLTLVLTAAAGELPDGVTAWRVACDCDRDAATGPLWSGTATRTGDTLTVTADTRTARFAALASPRMATVEVWADDAAVVASIPCRVCPAVAPPDGVAPLPAATYYTRSEVDNLLPSDLSDLSDASDLLGFQPVVALAAPSFAPQGARVYTYTLTGGETFAFDASNLPAGRVATFELWLTMPATAVAFTLPSVTWVEGSAPDFSDGSKVYKLAFRWAGADWEANLLYTREVAL